MKDHMIISMNKNNPQIFEPYKINIKTGVLEQLYKNEDALRILLADMNLIRMEDCVDLQDFVMV